MEYVGLGGERRGGGGGGETVEKRGAARQQEIGYQCSVLAVGPCHR